jgi:hypothetical protein
MHYRNTFRTFALAVVMLTAAACNAPVTAEDLAPPPSATSQPQPPADLQAGPTAAATEMVIDDLAPPSDAPTYVESNIPAGLEACPGEGLNLLASYEIEPEGISHVVIRYRLNGGSPETTGAWFEYVMAPEGILDALDHFRFQYPDLGADAHALFGGEAGALEYMLLATDNDALQSKWPAGEGTTAQMPLAACPQEASYTLHEYGVSSSSAGYGPGCSPTELTFEVIVSGYGQVQDAWLRYEYNAPEQNPGVVSPSFEIPLQPMGEGQGYPGSTRLAATVDVGSEANGYMGGQGGFLSYNMYVQVNGLGTFEYPAGGPPTVAVQSCQLQLGILQAVTPTPTQPLRLQVQPTATSASKR